MSIAPTKKTKLEMVKLMESIRLQALASMPLFEAHLIGVDVPHEEYSASLSRIFEVSKAIEKEISRQEAVRSNENTSLAVSERYYESIATLLDLKGYLLRGPLTGKGRYDVP
jgi:hypothetical protein